MSLPLSRCRNANTILDVTGAGCRPVGCRQLVPRPRVRARRSPPATQAPNGLGLTGATLGSKTDPHDDIRAGNRVCGAAAECVGTRPATANHHRMAATRGAVRGRRSWQVGSAYGWRGHPRVWAGGWLSDRWGSTRSGMWLPFLVQAHERSCHPGPSSIWAVGTARASCWAVSQPSPERPLVVTRAWFTRLWCRELVSHLLAHTHCAVSGTQRESPPKPESKVRISGAKSDAFLMLG
jgi:hypothetical protein